MRIPYPRFHRIWRPILWRCHTQSHEAFEDRNEVLKKRKTRGACQTQPMTIKTGRWSHQLVIQFLSIFVDCLCVYTCVFHVPEIKKSFMTAKKWVQFRVLTMLHMLKYSWRFRNPSLPVEVGNFITIKYYVPRVWAPSVVGLGISEDLDAAKVLLLALAANLASNAMGFLKWFRNAWTLHIFQDVWIRNLRTCNIYIWCIYI